MSDLPEQDIFGPQHDADSPSEEWLAGYNAGRAAALSNPTSSVSTEGVADGLSEAWAAAEAACGPADALTVGRIVTVAHGTVYWAGAGPDENDLAWMLGGKDTPAEALTELARRLTAINLDSPVEPDRG